MKPKTEAVLTLATEAEVRDGGRALDKLYAVIVVVLAFNGCVRRRGKGSLNERIDPLPIVDDRRN